MTNHPKFTESHDSAARKKFKIGEVVYLEFHNVYARVVRPYVSDTAKDVRLRFYGRFPSDWIRPLTRRERGEK
jgi:hypothetical protein